MLTTLGLDLYHGDSVSSFEDAHNDGIGFFILKASEGEAVVDSQFTKRYAELGERGYTRGAYHFFRCAQDPTKQAQHFLSVDNKRATWDLPPTIDIEVADGIGASEIVDKLQAFNSIIETETGHQCMLYTYIPFWKDSVGDSTYFSENNFKLWIARYTSADSPGPMPGGWSDWVLWQKYAGDSGAPHKSVAGIDGYPDVNIFKGSHDDLVKLFQLDWKP